MQRGDISKTIDYDVILKTSDTTRPMTYTVFKTQFSGCASSRQDECSDDACAKEIHLAWIMHDDKPEEHSIQPNMIGWRILWDLPAWPFRSWYQIPQLVMLVCLFLQSFLWIWNNMNCTLTSVSVLSLVTLVVDFGHWFLFLTLVLLLTFLHLLWRCSGFVDCCRFSKKHGVVSGVRYSMSRARSSKQSWRWTFELTLVQTPNIPQICKTNGDCDLAT